jgi:ribosome biogenesis GTPase A
MTHVKRSSSCLLLDMADQRPPQTAKESKGFRKALKKLFGRGSQSTPPIGSNSPPAVVASPLTVAVPPAGPLPPADLAPTVSTITTDPKEAAKLRAKYAHFRILVIGRANAGKTTLLKRVCDSKEDPVYSKVRYPLRLIPHSHHPFTDRLTRPRRCQLGDPCAFL